MEPVKQEEKAPEKKTKRMVRVRCLRPFSIDAQGGAGSLRIISAGTIVDVDADFAPVLLKETKGHHTFFGERYGKDADEGRAVIKYAELVVDQPQVA
jgi:hypothetical protein